MALVSMSHELTSYGENSQSEAWRWSLKIVTQKENPTSVGTARWIAPSVMRRRFPESAGSYE